MRSNMSHNCSLSEGVDRPGPVQEGPISHDGIQVFSLMSGSRNPWRGAWRSLTYWVSRSRRTRRMGAGRGIVSSVSLRGASRTRLGTGGPDPFPRGISRHLPREGHPAGSIRTGTGSFSGFPRALAARAASILNISEVARDCGVNHQTARNWLSLLESTRLVYLLRAYSRNVTKRVVKVPTVFHRYGFARAPIEVSQR
jgi:hypothetical protein